MIYQLADGQTDKYETVSTINDIDDFYLWISFKNRDKNIEKFFINESKGEGNKRTEKQTYQNVSDIPPELLKKFTG